MCSSVRGWANPSVKTYGCSFSPDVRRDRAYPPRFLARADAFFKELHRRIQCVVPSQRAQVAHPGLRPPAPSHRNVDVSTSRMRIVDTRRYQPGDGAQPVPSGRGTGSMVNKFDGRGVLANRNIGELGRQRRGQYLPDHARGRGQTGDRSNLSGVNHSVLHGFNYSPARRISSAGYSSVLIQRE